MLMTNKMIQITRVVMRKNLTKIVIGENFDVTNSIPDVGVTL